MEDSENSPKTDRFHTLGIVPVIKVPDFIDFNTSYDFRGSEHITFKIVKLNDDNIAKVMDRGEGKMSASYLINAIDSSNTTAVQ
jgi:hypothetical protein